MICQGCGEPQPDLDHLALVMRGAPNQIRYGKHQQADRTVAALLCAVCVVRVVFDLPEQESA